MYPSETTINQTHVTTMVAARLQTNPCPVYASGIDHSTVAPNVWLKYAGPRRAMVLLTDHVTDIAPASPNSFLSIFRVVAFDPDVHGAGPVVS